MSVTSLDDREMGLCPVCERRVMFRDNFLRHGRITIHVVCLAGLRHAGRSLYTR